MTQTGNWEPQRRQLTPARATEIYRFLAERTGAKQCEPEPGKRITVTDVSNYMDAGRSPIDVLIASGACRSELEAEEFLSGSVDGTLRAVSAGEMGVVQAFYNFVQIGMLIATAAEVARKD